MKTLSSLFGIGLALIATPLFAQVPLEHFQCYAVVKMDPLVNVPVDSVTSSTGRSR